MFIYTVMCLLFQKSLRWHIYHFPIQAEYDAMLLEFAGEGIPLVAAAVSADKFAPFLNDLLPLIMSKAVSEEVHLEYMITLVRYKHWHTFRLNKKHLYSS